MNKVFTPHRWLVLGTGLTAFALQAWGQRAPDLSLQPAPAAQFSVKGFEVTGENPLTRAQVDAALAPFVRPDATLTTLQQAAAALETALREHGFGLHRVALAPQTVGDSVRLNVVRFTLASVKVEGAEARGEANIRRSLPELKEGGTPNFQQLAVQTAIANENQGKQVQVAMREAAEADKIDATVLVKETRLWNLNAGLNNNGSEATGRDRFTLAGTHTNVLGLDHQFTAAYTTSLEQSSRVKQLGLSYRAPLYTLGGVLGASYTRSDVVGSFGTFNSTGAGHTTGVNYTHYLVPKKGYRAYVTLGLDDKAFNPTQINGATLVGQVLRRSRQLSLSYAARRDAERSLFSYNLDLAANLPGGDGNNLAAYQSEDPRVSTSRWKALRGNLSYAQSLVGGWQWMLRGAAQVSPDALISGEQFGLGGVSSVRGTSERPLAGDSGASGTFELTTPELSAGLRLVGFVDAGWLGNRSATPSKPSSDALASSGVGLRYGTQHVSVLLDYAYLLKGSNVPQTLNSTAPQKGDQKLHLSLNARF